MLFLYQPFEMPVMRLVMARVSQSLAVSPRPVIVIYIHPVHGRVFDGSPLLERALTDSYELEEHEVPFSYGGISTADSFKIWVTRQPRPALKAHT